MWFFVLLLNYISNPFLIGDRFEHFKAVIENGTETWEECEQIKEAFAEPFLLLKLFDGDTPCLGKVYPKFHKMVNALRSGGLNFLHRNNKTVILNLAEQRLSEVKSYDVIVTAAALDPEYWGHRDLFEEDRVVTINLLQVLFLSLNV